MAGQPQDSWRSHNFNGHCNRLVERVCATVIDTYGTEDGASIFDGDEPVAGPDQTAEFVRSGYERVVRYAVILTLLAVAGFGYVKLCQGIDASQQLPAVRVSPEIGPVPPVDGSGCMATWEVSGYVVGRFVE